MALQKTTSVEIRAESERRDQSAKHEKMIVSKYYTPKCSIALNERAYTNSTIAPKE